jgi:flagellar FliL protein
MADDEKAESAGSGAKSKNAKGKSAKGRKMGKVALVLVLLVGAAGGYLAKGAGGGAEAAGATATTAPPKPGLMVELDPMSLNLADGRYLRVGVAVQLVEGEGHDPESWLAEHGPVIRDLLIAQLGGVHAADLTDAAGRDVVRGTLLRAANERLEGKVYALFFTEFVMQ